MLVRSGTCSRTLWKVACPSKILPFHVRDKRCKSIHGHLGLPQIIAMCCRSCHVKGRLDIHAWRYPLRWWLFAALPVCLSFCLPATFSPAVSAVAAKPVTWKCWHPTPSTPTHVQLLPYFKFLFPFQNRRILKTSRVPLQHHRRKRNRPGNF